MKMRNKTEIQKVEQGQIWYLHHIFNEKIG